jgi:hypothetical protein
MEKNKILAALTVLIAIICIIACEKNDQSLKQSAALSDAHNLAHQTKGFYSPPVKIAVKKTIENEQGVIHLSFSSSHIKPYLIKLFLDKDSYKKVDILEGNYEILFMRNILTINQSETGSRYDFVVDNDELANIKAILPKDYLVPGSIDVIGMSVFGLHSSSLRDSPGLSPDEGCAIAGGPGSTSCSNACCSTSCETGYYAYCGNTCSCEKKTKSN